MEGGKGPAEASAARIGHGVAGHRRPADPEHDRSLFGVPGMIDAVEQDVVALLGQYDAAPRQADPEPAADQHDHGGALFPGDPLAALITPRVHSPLDLDIG